MVTNFYISTDKFFRGNGIIPFLTKAITNDDLNYNIVLNEVIRDIKRLHDIYILSMLDDGKITGRERIHICRELDNLIGDLILLRLILTDNKKQFDLINSKYALNLTFKCYKARWEGYGTMGIIKSIGKDKMKDWIQSSYSQKLKRLISYSRLAMNDGRIEPHELEIISSFIEKLLLSLIIARKDIFSANIS